MIGSTQFIDILFPKNIEEKSYHSSYESLIFSWIHVGLSASSDISSWHFFQIKRNFLSIWNSYCSLFWFFQQKRRVLANIMSHRRKVTVMCQQKRREHYVTRAWLPKPIKNQSEMKHILSKKSNLFSQVNFQLHQTIFTIRCHKI